MLDSDESRSEETRDSPGQQDKQQGNDDQPLPWAGHDEIAYHTQQRPPPSARVGPPVASLQAHVPNPHSHPSFPTSSRVFLQDRIMAAGGRERQGEKRPAQN
jgi:hypothetical protein